MPIREYALIGDCHGTALVARDGSIDWCCFGRFDIEPALWRLLDAQKGAFWQIRPDDEAAIERAYIPDTNILRTTYTTRSGKVSVTDFMPIGRDPSASARDYTKLTAADCLVRRIEGLEGKVGIRIRFAAGRTSFTAGKPQSLVLRSERGSRSRPSAENVDTVIEVSATECQHFLLSPRGDAANAIMLRADEVFGITRSFWEEWCGQCRYRGAYPDMVRRSALALKLLTFTPTGAIVAAPTTSLPEEIGGVRNWDYRFAWLRDSAFTLHALAALGYGGEARRFCEFQRLCCLATLPNLRSLYGICGETTLNERTLDHLDGYSGSRPVRIGNAAHVQRQGDVYGELLDWAHLYHALGEPIDSTLEQIIRGVADHVAAHWREPDQGLWEARSESRHYVHSLIMSWVALDRALRLLGPNPTWKTERDSVFRTVLERGVHPAGGHLVQAFDTEDVDAALLLAPFLDLPLDRGVLMRTVEAVERHLREGDYVRRYLTPDGLPGGEGAFLICSFWLVDALLVLGREGEARALFERLLSKSNDVGLYAEEIDPRTEAFLGNFPQAFTHLALINSAALLELCEREGVGALAGTHADRARKTAGRRDEKVPLAALGNGARDVDPRRSILDLHSVGGQ